MFRTLFTQNKKSIFLLLYFGIMPVLMGGMVSTFALQHMEQIRSSNSFTLFSINILVSLFLALGFIPTTFYSLLCGYILGWSALPLVLLSYTLACGLGYTFCKRIDNGTLLNVFQEKYDVLSIKSKLETSGIWIPVMCRLSPALPFAILNAVFAMFRFPFIRYMIGSITGMVPRTVFAIYIGKSFTRIHSVEDMKSDLSLWFAIILAIISFAGIGWIVKRKLS